MRHLPQLTARPAGVGARLLLVLAVLAGLVAMHHLAPTGVISEGAATAAHLRTHNATAEAVDAPCHHQARDHQCHSHADLCCAAASLSGTPLLPAVAATAVRAATATPPAHRVPGAALGGRAPPSLNQLQLLRI
ncbi:DUF6153 family protein [Sphaerisporangium viridialbum]|uniref:DUF6153 family protein n=1 Tax=Sphaerisporangium viridialbum TaxID=46189 RepID=UPI003C793E59